MQNPMPNLREEHAAIVYLREVAMQEKNVDIKEFDVHFEATVTPGANLVRTTWLNTMTIFRRAADVQMTASEIL